MATKTKPPTNEEREENEKDKFGTVLQELDDVGQYRCRIIEVKGEKVLDIRQWLETESYKGFTRKGIRIKAEHLTDFIEMVDSAKEHLVED